MFKFDELKRKVFEAVNAGSVEIVYMSDSTVAVRVKGEVHEVCDDNSFDSIKSMIDLIDGLEKYDDFLDEVDELIVDIFKLTRDINRARFKECGDIKAYLNITRCVVSVAIFNGDDVEIYDKTVYLGDALELDAKSQELALDALKDMVLKLDAVYEKGL